MFKKIRSLVGRLFNENQQMIDDTLKKIGQA